MYSNTTSDFRILFMSRGCTMIPTNTYTSVSLPLALITDLPFLNLLAEPPCSLSSTGVHLFHFLIPMLSHLLASFKQSYTPGNRLLVWKSIFGVGSFFFFTKSPKNLTSTMRPTRRKFIKFNAITKSGCAPHATNVTWVLILWSLCKL